MDLTKKRQFSLILFNISKKNNFGQILRTADALGVSEIIIIGKKKYHLFGNFKAINKEVIQHFYTFSEALDYLRKRNYKIIGVEISKDAYPIEEQPFFSKTAFLMGNEGEGLSGEQIKVCDRLVYIKQFGAGASLNVNVAAGIAFHHFSLWSGLQEGKIEAHKFKIK